MDQRQDTMPLQWPQVQQQIWPKIDLPSYKSWKIGVLERQNRTILRTINDIGGGALVILVLVSLNPPGLELVASLAEILLSLATIRTIRTIRTMTQDETNPLWLTDCDGDLKVLNPRLRNLVHPKLHIDTYRDLSKDEYCSHQKPSNHPPTWSAISCMKAS